MQKENLVQDYTASLCCKQLEKTDFELYYQLFGSQQVMRYAMLDPFSDEKDLMPYFNQVVAHQMHDKKIYSYVISLQDGTEIGIGEIEVLLSNEAGGIGEMGYFLLPNFWGKGYATEIATLLCSIGFEQLGLHKIFASCHADNKGSERIMQKIGMKFEGCLYKARWKHGEWHDELRYCILKEDWK